VREELARKESNGRVSVMNQSCLLDFISTGAIPVNRNKKIRTNSQRADDCELAYCGSRLCGSYSSPLATGGGTLSMGVRKSSDELKS
jgi:hypothetical protein